MHLHHDLEVSSAATRAHGSHNSRHIFRFRNEHRWGQRRAASSHPAQSGPDLRSLKDGAAPQWDGISPAVTGSGIPVRGGRLPGCFHSASEVSWATGRSPLEAPGTNLPGGIPSLIPSAIPSASRTRERLRAGHGGRDRDVSRSPGESEPEHESNERTCHDPGGSGGQRTAPPGKSQRNRMGDR